MFSFSARSHSHSQLISNLSYPVWSHDQLGGLLFNRLKIPFLMLRFAARHLHRERGTQGVLPCDGLE